MSLRILTAAAIVMTMGMGGQTFAQAKQAAGTKKPAASPSTKQSGYAKLSGGVDYKIIKHGTGKKAEVGEFVEMHIVMKADTMVLHNSRMENHNKAVTLPINKTTNRGDWTVAFPYLSVGDSAVIRVSMDTILAMNAGQKLPPFITKGKKLYYEVNVVKLKSAEENTKEMEAGTKEMQEMMKKQAQTDDKLLQDYFAANNIKANKTASGLYYTIQTEGTGENVAKGQKVSVNYTGKLLNGKMFDSNVDPSKGHVSPFEFAVGQGSVIPGWDEGLTLLKKGSKATLYIPSPLGYGPRAAGADIGPNSVLIFDIEVLDIK